MPPRAVRDKAANGGNGAATRRSVDDAVWSACDILRRSNCAGALQYVPELSWMLFLRILDEREAREADEAEAFGQPFTPSLEAPYRWRDWAAPNGPKRRQLQEGNLKDFFAFVNGQPDDEARGRPPGLIPHLRQIGGRIDATARQKVISQILASTERTRVDTEKNLQDALDRIHAIDVSGEDYADLFPLSQVYEGLLLKMGEKGNDGGQFFTPREVIRAIVRTIDPKPSETVYDPGCGTGGFLIEAFKHMRQAARVSGEITSQEMEAIGQDKLFGREKENLVFPIALANMVLHGIDAPKLWLGNTLSQQETYGGLWTEAPALFDVVLTNPPFGGKENAGVQTRFDYRTSATQILFLQDIIGSLKPDGRCGMVVDEGVMFRTNERAFVGAKRQLLDRCDLWAVVFLAARCVHCDGRRRKNEPPVLHTRQADRAGVVL